MVFPNRSAIMASIHSKDTKPEVAVRKALHKLGYRFRIHVATLPGSPDIMLPAFRTVVQVKGCFWHSHHCKAGKVPTANRDYWIPKLTGNLKRDKRNERRLRRMGWSVKTIWECSLAGKNQEEIEALVRRKISRMLK